MDLITIGYDISYDPVYTRYHKMMPEEFKSKYEEFHFKLQKHDLTILNHIETFSQKYENPVINNMLYNCYILAGRFNDAAKIAEYNFNKFPDYLFGRFNYASLHILKKDYKSIPKILNFQFDLKSIEPSRNIFHISEVLSFHKLLYYYHTGINEYKNAKRHFEIISKLDVEGKVKSELAKVNTNIQIRRVITTTLCIFLIPFIMIIAIYNLLKDIIRGCTSKFTKKMN